MTENIRGTLCSVGKMHGLFCVHLKWILQKSLASKDVLNSRKVSHAV